MADVTPTTRIGLRPDDAAAALGCSRRHLELLDQAGEIGPAPRRLGRAVVWCAAELADWLATPGSDGKLLDRVQWSKLRKTRK